MLKSLMIDLLQNWILVWLFESCVQDLSQRWRTGNVLLKDIQEFKSANLWEIPRWLYKLYF